MSHTGVWAQPEVLRSPTNLVKDDSTVLGKTGDDRFFGYGFGWLPRDFNSDLPRIHGNRFPKEGLHSAARQPQLSPYSYLAAD